MLSHTITQYFSNPAHEKLLPDLLPPPYQRPYTLIIEMNDILIHSEYEVGYSIDNEYYSFNGVYHYVFRGVLVGSIRRDQGLINSLI